MLKKYLLIALFAYIIISCNDSEPEVGSHEIINDFSSEGFMIYTLYASNNSTIWCGSDAGLYSYNGKNWNKYIDDRLSANITAIAQLESELYVGTQDTGVLVFKIADDQNTISFQEEFNTSNCVLHHNEVRVLVVQGTKVFMGTTGGLVYKDGDTWVEEVHPQLEESIINSLSIVNNHFYIARLGEPFFHGKMESDFDAITGATNLHPEFNGKLSTDYGYSTVADAADNMWIGSDLGLTSMHLEKNRVSDGYLHYYLIGEKIKCLLATPEGEIWVGKESGLSVYNGTDWENFTTSQGLEQVEYITRFSSADIDTSVSIRQQVPQLPDSIINTLALDPQGIIWVGTNNGIVTYDGSTWLKY